MQIELTTEEQELLLQLLESRINQLRPEIRRSREHPYRDTLKLERNALMRLLQRLSGAELPAGSVVEPAPAPARFSKPLL